MYTTDDTRDDSRAVCALQEQHPYPIQFYFLTSPLPFSPLKRVVETGSIYSCSLATTYSYTDPGTATGRDVSRGVL